jgi:hypothetical protein
MKTITNLIDRKIQLKARQLEKLTRLIKASLPVNCQSHVQVSAIREFQLILITDSPAWSSRLRLYSQNMIQMLAEHTNIRVNRVRIKLSQPKKSITKPIKKFRYLNKNTASLIQQTAATINDPDLQQALINLAKKTAPDTGQ